MSLDAPLAPVFQMTPLSTAEQIREAWKLIENPAFWCQGHWSDETTGRRCAASAVAMTSIGYGGTLAWPHERLRLKDVEAAMILAEVADETTGMKEKLTALTTHSETYWDVVDAICAANNTLTHEQLGEIFETAALRAEQKEEEG